MAKEFNIPGLKDAVSEVERLQKAVKDAASDMLTFAINSEKAMQPFKGNTSLLTYNEALKKSTETQKETKETTDKLQQAQDRLAFAQSEVGKKIAAVNLEIQKQTAENKKSAAGMNENRTALEKYNAIVLDATSKAKNLGAALEIMKMEGKAGTPEFEKLNKKFEESAASAKILNDRYREIAKASGDNRALVGSYSDELKDHFKSLESTVTNVFSNLQASILKGDFKGAINEVRTVVTGFGKDIKGVNDVVSSYTKNLFTFKTSNSEAAAAVDLNSASISSQNVIVDANAVSTESATATKIGFVQSQVDAAAATELSNTAQQSEIATSEASTVANEANTAAAIENAAAVDAGALSGEAAAAVQAELSASQSLVAVTNEAVAISAAKAAMANELLAVSESEAAAAAAALAATTGAAAAGAQGMAAAEAGAAATSEGLAVGSATAATGVGLLDVALGILLAPITLVVLAIGALFYIFKDFAPIVNPIKDAFSALGAVFESLKQDVFDFITGARSLAEILDTFTGKASEAATEAYNLGQATRDLNKAQEIQAVTSARADVEIGRLLLRGRDLSKSYAERNAALLEAIRLERQKSEQELKNNAEAIRIAALRLFEGKELNKEQKKWIEEQNFAKIRGLKVSMNLDKEELDAYQKLLIDKANLQKAAMAVEEKAQNRVNKNIQRDEQAKAKAQDDAVKAQEKAEAAAEKAAKARLDAEKKSLELVINTKKTTLDFMVSSYKQEENLIADNLGFVLSVSHEKQAIADLEMQKALVGVKKGSDDEKAVKQKHAADIQKIKLEESQAINSIIDDDAKAEIELFDLKNKALVDGGKDLTDLLVDNEKDRQKKRLDLLKKSMREELNIDKELSDAKLKNMAETNQELTKNQRKYLTFLKTETEKTDKDLKKLDSDLMKSKFKTIDDEIDLEKRKFKLLNKSSSDNSKQDLLLERKGLIEKRKTLLEEQKAESVSTKKYGEIQDDVKEIDLKVAENRKKLREINAAENRESLDAGLKALTEIAGKETVVGKAAAIAQATVNIAQGVTKEYAKGGLIGIGTAALIAAAGAVQIAKIAGVQFYKGTNNAPYTGKAIVDELGAELHFDKHGNLKSSGSDAGARVTDIEIGDKIIPADITSIIKKNMFSQYQNISSKSETIDYEKLGDQFGMHADKIVREVRRKRPSSMNVYVQGNSKDRVRFKGKNI